MSQMKEQMKNFKEAACGSCNFKCREWAIEASQLAYEQDENPAKCLIIAISAQVAVVYEEDPELAKDLAQDILSRMGHMLLPYIMGCVEEMQAEAMARMQGKHSFHSNEGGRA